MGRRFRGARRAPDPADLTFGILCIICALHLGINVATTCTIAGLPVCGHALGKGETWQRLLSSALRCRARVRATVFSNHKGPHIRVPISVFPDRARSSGRDEREREQMARRETRPEVSRRKFLAGVAVAGAAATATKANAATPGTTAADVKRLPAAVRPTAHQIAAEAGIPKDMPHLAGKPEFRLHGRRHQVARRSNTSIPTRPRASAACMSC